MITMKKLHSGEKKYVFNMKTHDFNTNTFRLNRGDDVLCRKTEFDQQLYTFEMTIMKIN